MKRTAEFVLGLIGGIFGIICAFVALLIGGMGALLKLMEQILLLV